MQLVYVIQDNVSKQSSPLFFAPNEGTAQRQFAQFVDNERMNPRDYDLYEVGSFEPESLTLDGLVAARHVINGAALTYDYSGKGDS